MGFFRHGTNAPLKVLKVVKGIKKDKCSECGSPVEAGLLKHGKCKHCVDKSAKK